MVPVVAVQHHQVLSTVEEAMDQWHFQHSNLNAAHVTKDQQGPQVHLVMLVVMAKMEVMVKTDSLEKTEKLCHQKNRKPNLASIAQQDHQVRPALRVPKARQVPKVLREAPVVKENVVNVVWSDPRDHPDALVTLVAKDPKGMMGKLTKLMALLALPVDQEAKVRKAPLDPQALMANQVLKDHPVMAVMLATQDQMAKQVHPDQEEPKVQLDHLALATTVHHLELPLDIKFSFKNNVCNIHYQLMILYFINLCLFI